MKKTAWMSSILVILMLCCSCSVTELSKQDSIELDEEMHITLDVTTTWAGNDGGTKTYQKYINSYMKESGNIINDYSGGSDETFKQRVQLDFEVGGESDVLFYFNGSDANAFIQAGKVVPIKTIQELYPDYASNLNEEVFVPSEVDGEVYALPAYGYWEALFVNKELCRKAGVKIPDANTTWEEFLEICEKIRDAGYTPIAASLANEPHYWFEFSIYNQMSPQTHGQIPDTMDSISSLAWQAGLADLKEMYEKGFFPRNTLYTSADESFQRFIDGEAAFLVDGSWKMGTISSNVENVEDFTVTYVPGKGKRKNTDVIGGFSSGWYITAKAWKDLEKREAAVEFINYMTSDEAISDFASITLSSTALKEGAQYDESALNSLQKDAVSMLENITSISPAVQDSLSVTCRTPFFDGMPNLVTGRVEIDAALGEFLKLRKEETDNLTEK